MWRLMGVSCSLVIRRAVCPLGDSVSRFQAAEGWCGGGVSIWAQLLGLRSELDDIWKHLGSVSSGCEREDGRPARGPKRQRERFCLSLLVVFKQLALGQEQRSHETRLWLVDVGTRTVSISSRFLHVSLKNLKRVTHFLKEPSRPIDLDINGWKRVVSKKAVEMGNSSYSEVNIQYIVGPLRMAVFGNGLTHELVDHKDSTAYRMERAQLVGRSHIKGGVIGIMTGILI